MKLPFIENMHNFATVAKSSGFQIEGEAFVKRWNYPGDIEIDLKVDFKGNIDFKMYQSNIKQPPLSYDDMNYFLKNISYLVGWKTIKEVKRNTEE